MSEVKLTKFKKSLVEAVKLHALENYERGWDVVVETMTDEEIAAEFGQAATAKGAIKCLKRNVVQYWIEGRLNAAAGGY